MAEKDLHDKMDKLTCDVLELRTICQGFMDRASKMLEDHERVLYGEGMNTPGLIGMVQEADRTLTKVKKIALTGATAAVGACVSQIAKLFKIGE